MGEEGLVIDDYEDVEAFLEVEVGPGKDVPAGTFKGYETSFRRVFPDIFGSIEDLVFNDGRMAQSSFKSRSLFKYTGLDDSDYANKNNVTGALTYLSFFPDNILEVEDSSPKRYRVNEDFFEVADRLEEGLQRWETRENEQELVEEALAQYSDEQSRGKADFASNYLEDRLGYEPPKPTVKEHIRKVS